MTSIVPPEECFQISLSIDKNLMGYVKNTNTQLFIMNELLSKCLELCQSRLCVLIINKKVKIR